MDDVKPAGMKAARSLAELSRQGFSVFSLGPLYVYAGVPVDLVEAWAKTHQGEAMRHNQLSKGVLTLEKYKLEIRGELLRFDRPVVARCKEWNTLLYLLDNVSYLQFKQWMLEQQFSNRNEKQFWVPRLFSARVIDPVYFAASGLAVPASLDVFSVSGFKGCLAVKNAIAATKPADVPLVIDFEWQPAEPDVIKQGRAALNILQEV